MAAGTPMTSGILFGPSANGKNYLSVYAHRGSHWGKSQWSIPPNHEFGIFDRADQSNWVDNVGNYWGVDGATANAIGTRGEKLSHFPCTSNAHDPWHGYPVSPLEDGDRASPPDYLVEDWISHGVVTR